MKKNKVTKWTDSGKLNHTQQSSYESPHRDQGHFNNGFLEKAQSSFSNPEELEHGPAILGR